VARKVQQQLSGTHSSKAAQNLAINGQGSGSAYAYQQQ
jgi:hypothetical protein